MKYNIRTSAPSKTNKNYLHYSKSKSGGYNYCIHIADGSCLPNCVGYAWGRWREILGKFHNLPRTNAENWFGNTSDGYERGQTPRVGAVICWRKGQAGNGSDGAGHVGIVEKINSDGSILVSNSAYKGARFYLKTLKAPYNIGSAYTFQGFIYFPEALESADNQEKEKTVKASDYARGRNNNFKGTYTATANLNVRDGAGTNKKILVTIPKGTKVISYGYYTKVKNTVWLYVTFSFNGVNYTGFCSSDYLMK